MTAIALIRNSDDAILGTYHHAPGRLDLPSNPPSQVSPPVAGWSNAGFRIVTLHRFTTPDGKVRVGSPTYTLEADGVHETYAVENAPQSAGITYKADVFRRMTDTEYETYEFVRNQQDRRKAAIFDHATVIERGGAEFAELLDAFKAAYGEARAAELLAASA